MCIELYRKVDNWLSDQDVHNIHSRMHYLQQTTHIKQMQRRKKTEIIFRIDRHFGNWNFIINIIDYLFKIEKTFEVVMMMSRMYVFNM